MPSELPSGWKVSQLGEVASVILSNVDKKSKIGEESVRLCNYMDVYANGTITSQIDFMEATATRAQVEKFGIRRGDVMITKDSEDPTDIAIPAVVAEDFREHVLCGYHLALLRPRNIDGEYLAWALRSWAINNQFVRRANGATRFGVTSGVIHKVEVPIPPLPEQKKIAAILSSVDEAIQAKRAVIEQTRRVKEGLLQDLLTRGIGHTRFKQTEIGQIPEGWEVRRLASMASRLHQGVNTAAEKVEYPARGFRILQAKHITSGTIRSAGARFVSGKDYDKYESRYQPRYGDVLFTNIGTIGKSVVVQTNDRFLIAWNIFVISLKPQFSSAFLNYYLQHLDNVHYFMAHAAGNATKFVNKSMLGHLCIPIPSDGEIQTILEILSQVDAHLRSTDSVVARLQQVKAGLLQDLLTGNVRVTV